MNERLDVYGTALDYVAVADAIVDSLPLERSQLSERIHNTAIDLALITARIAGEDDAARTVYRDACRIATECATLLDVCARLQLSVTSLVDPGRHQLLEIVTSMTQLAQPQMQRLSAN
jgi:hypothetical protein